MRTCLSLLLVFALLAVPGRIASATEPGEEPFYLGAKGHGLYVIPIQGDRPGLLTFQGPAERGISALFAWLEGDEWHSLPVALNGLTGYPTHGAVIRKDRSPVLLIGMEGQGSGGFGQLAQARQDGSGILQASPLMDVTEKVNFDFLEPSLILMTYRGDIYSPTAWNCNACWPVNDQKLLRWENGHVRVLGQRVLPEPCFTATRFLGLLGAGEKGKAARLAASRNAVKQAQQLLEIQANAPFPWHTEDCWHAGGAGLAIERLERRNWDLIPAPYRTRLPKEMQQFDLTLKRGSDRAILQMVRRPEGWMVTGVLRGQDSGEEVINLGATTLVFDTGATVPAARELRTAAERLTGNPVTYVVNSHVHPEHVNGNVVYQDATLIASEESRKAIATDGLRWMEQMRRELDGRLEGYPSPSDLRVPTLSFADELIVHGTHHTVRLIACGNAHSECDAVLWLPEAGILFTGDLITDGNLVLCYGNPERWLSVLNR